MDDVEKIARALCRASGGDPDCPVTTYFEPSLMETPMGKVQGVMRPADEPLPLWFRWRNLAEVALAANNK